MKISHSCETDLANQFVRYFDDKIKSISEDLKNFSKAPDYMINIASDFDGMPSRSLENPVIFTY